MFKTIINSPWSGAVGALVSALWEGFWLIGPPIGLSESDVKWYLTLGLFAMLLSGGQAFYVLKKKITALEDKINSAPNLVAVERQMPERMSGLTSITLRLPMIRQAH